MESGSSATRSVADMILLNDSFSALPPAFTEGQRIVNGMKDIQRLEESRRMRLGYLDTWPDTPFLDVYRDLSPRFVARVGEINAVAAFLYGLQHEVGHYDQMRETRRQALSVNALQSGD